MVKVEEVYSKRTDSNGVGHITASLFADTKNEVVSGMKLGDDVIDFGSDVTTADFEIGQLDSDGTWHWA